ncbi:peptidoglycan DD-metalloendopeptidase family protein [Paenibacillus nasutitermitis]|uniref:M23ase beta-sheet core domain-containing protein n=1 Tax=Paenibacillus nasutitermitis TaxID=1652958 RepID=A0A916YR65_9BACL|nr:peptidoglycan DD-metalloendopeptidase family protein [Paenibacillus nasutitermitis]GGD56153.1 hypothetical protein GCM10010911_12350 [Paenibacillus nasutitermitis]
MKIKLFTALALTAVVLTGCGNGDKKPEAGPPAESAGKAGSNTPGNSGTKPDILEAKLNAQQVAQALLDGDYPKIYEQLSEAFKQQLTLAELETELKKIMVSVESWKPESKLSVNEGQYVTFTNQDQKLGLIFTMGEKNEITMLQAIPLQSFPETDSSPTKRVYSLPFKGEWFVYWGGENVLANYHYEEETQRYASDMIQVKDGYSYNGDPKINESYYAFGEEISAPQDGKVVEIVNDIDDNIPGQMNPDQPAGNVVVIDHGNGEYSFLAHLKKGSVTVKAGDKVAKGDTVGQCGNSGNSSEPHLHVQVSDNQDLFSGKSIRMQWENDIRLHQGESVKC